MSLLVASIGLGALCFIAWVVTSLVIHCRQPRGNRCVRGGKNILPPPSPACERTFRLAER